MEASLREGQDRFMNYRESGVDIDAGDAWIEAIKGALRRRKGELPESGGIGGFCGLHSIGGGRSIAACTDGVGTKLLLGEALGEYRGLGQDLVAMSVNDLVTCGASPLFFLDYIACDKLDAAMAGEIIEGVIDGCAESRCALLGGETAELPGLYPPGGFDLAGFAVGIVDNERIIDGSGIREGDSIIGLKSSGLHSNGYSLTRRALTEDGLRLALVARPDELGGETLGEALIRPTRIYVRQALAAVAETAAFSVRGMAHVTGGGLAANIDRLMPEGLSARIDYDAWDRPGIFALLRRAGVEEAEMRRVFNLGIGFVFIVPEEASDSLTGFLRGLDEAPATIGRAVNTGR
ncbi:MAG: phosphoribosylformylglycinamidine cyclo-ligase [Synergistaceae bacterium]|jgi:phosphoribosylformylglycinamidine cyclo-ligase|nr:phosphoribosylformylglycinamidine cyclo-ligase [Synergistaceae bacterium]